MRGSRVLLFVLFALPLLARGAVLGATVTILDGEATLLRGVAKAGLAEGVRLSAGDIVETGPATRLLRLELDDGAPLDLGPATRVQLMPRLTGDTTRRAARAYLLQGWAKLGAGKTPADGVVIASPVLDLAAPKRSVVLALDGEQTFVFAESGEASFTPRNGNRAAPAVTLKSGEFHARSADKSATSARPSPAFLQRVPRAFQDTLPSRLKQFSGSEVQPRPLGAITYADAQPWIDAEPGLRGGFVLRWRLLARQEDFRRRLQEGMAAHPEWDPLLNPEKYLPRAASAASAGLVSPGSPKTYR